MKLQKEKEEKIMKILVCDRCGQKVVLPKDNKKNTSIRSVEVVDEFGQLYHRADMCPSCLYKFYEWLGVVAN